MNFNELRDRAYKSACEHGFYDKKYSDEHWKMQIICEVAEMVEAHRDGDFADVEAFKKSDTVNDCDFNDKFNRFIKDTMEDEMADVAILLLSYSGLKGYEVDWYIQYAINILKSLGGYMNLKGSLCEYGFRITKELTCIDSESKYEENVVASILVSLYTVAQEKRIDLLWHIEQKMRYNEMRPMLNGKRY